MKINLVDAVKKAITEGDVHLASAVADALRFKCGFNYDAVFAFAHEHTGVSAPVWESMMYEADSGYE